MKTRKEEAAVSLIVTKVTIRQRDNNEAIDEQEVQM